MAFPTTHPALARALADRNYDTPTEVQQAVLAADVERDLLVSAQTGSGKTVAYGLAIGATLLGSTGDLGPRGTPLALIVAPTRELALQVQRELSWLFQHTGARIVSCVGGMDPQRERRLLAEGADVVVGTPGRLCDHLRRKSLDMTRLKAVVLDEADEMLDLGFREDLEALLEAMPEARRTLLFSATLPKDIIALTTRYQRNSLRIEVAGEQGGHADIEYRAIRIAPHEVEHAVVNLLRHVDAPAALVFCNTRDAVRHLQATLSERGFAVVALSGELTQSERNHALQALRDGRARVCVATDVAARGIDLPSLGLVIHAELPNDPEVLQHRSGRTGRAGRKGISALLVPPSRRWRADQLLNLLGVEAAWGKAPSADEIRVLDQQRLLQDPLLQGDGNEDDLAWARALLAERSAEEVAAALVRLYRARLPAPEDITDPGERRPRPERRGPHEPRGAREPRAERPARAPRPPRADTSGGTVWFSLNIGRRKKADPRWLVPLICRRGGITNSEIGAIRIFDNDSKFEVVAAAAEQFDAAIRAGGGEGVFARLDAPPGDGEAPAAARREKPAHRGNAKDAPFKAKFKDGKFKGAKGGHKDGARNRPEARSDERPAKDDRPKHGKPSFGKASFGKNSFSKNSFSKTGPGKKPRSKDGPRT